MEIVKTKNGNELVVALSGRLDTITSSELDASLKDELENVEKVIFDFKNLEYISSAGLRVLLGTQKILGGKDKLEVINTNPIVKEIFSVTGFEKVLVIK